MKISHNSSKTIRQAERVASDSTLYSETKKRFKFFERKKL